MIIIIGPHRSGTSVTTKIIQDHLGKFPFPTTRWSEPCELVDIHTQFMERNNMTFIDRLYFPELQPDNKLLEDSLKFFLKYESIPCVIKEPVLCITMKWLKLDKKFPVVFIHRGETAMAKSLIFHKKIDQEYAEKSSRWYHEEYFKLLKNQQALQFDRNTYKEQMKNLIALLNIPWNEAVFAANWDEKKIVT